MKNKQPERKKKAVSLSEGMAEYLNQAKTAAPSPKINLKKIWDGVAPTRFLAHTDNVVYVKGSTKTALQVYVDSNLFATELTMEKELYRLKMQEALGKEVADIEFCVSRKTAFRNKM